MRIAIIPPFCSEFFLGGSLCIKNPIGCESSGWPERQDERLQIDWRRLKDLARTLRSGWGCRGFAYNQLRLYQNFARFFRRLLDPLNESSCCKLAHVDQGLADGREAWNVKGGLFNVVEANHRDVVGHGETRIAKSANCADRRPIVECH